MLVDISFLTEIRMESFDEFYIIHNMKIIFCSIACCSKNTIDLLKITAFLAVTPFFCDSQ